MDNSDPPKPTVSAYFDDYSSNEPISPEAMAQYFVSMIDETKSEELTRKLCAEGLVVDQVLCTLIASLSGFLATVYAEDEQRACSAYGHLMNFGHALMHELIQAGAEGDAESLSDS